jgi:hypothetical protein
MVFLVGVLVTATVLAVLMQVGNRLVSGAGAVLLGILVLCLCIASLFGLNARRPAAFLIGDGAFTMPPNINTIMSAATCTGLTLSAAGHAADQARRGPDPFQTAVAVLLVILLPVLWYAALGRFGTVLRPDGVLHRQPLGSIFVPWEAGPEARPTSVGVKLRLARPDLAVRRGFRAGTSIATGADPGFTAWAINLYAARPADRPAIGTQEGLHRLDEH